MNMNYKSIGDIGVSCVIGDLAKFGIISAPPLSDNFPFDIIGIAENKLFKIQVKSSSASHKDESICFKLTTSDFYKGTCGKSYSEEDCDLIACYDLVNKKTFLIIHSDLGGRKSLTIRYTAAKSNIHKTINWWEDFVLSNKRIKEVFNCDSPDFSKIFSTLGENKKYDKICESCSAIYLTGYARSRFCSTKCQGAMTRKVARPTKEELEEMIHTMPITHVGKKFSVSDNAIRKWARDYGIDLKIVSRFVKQ